MSAKRKATQWERHKAVNEAMRRAGYQCQAREVWPDVECAGGLDGDEIVPRGRGGDPLDPENVQILCRAHHNAKHDHPAEAERLGLTRSLHS